MEQRRLLNRIARAIGAVPGVLAVVLYGSFARGDYGPKSDVDLLILVRSSAQARQVTEQLAEQEFVRQLQPAVRTASQLKKTDPGLLGNVFRDGKVLLLKEPLGLPAASLLNLKPFALFSFSMKGLTQPQKARFNRLLYPHRTGSHSYPGLLADLGGFRVSSGCFLLPQRSCRKMEGILDRHRVSFESRPVWM